MMDKRQSNIEKLVKELEKFNKRHVKNKSFPLDIKLRIQLMIEDVRKMNAVDSEQAKTLVDSLQELVVEGSLPLWTMLDVHELCYKVHNLSGEICAVAV